MKYCKSSHLKSLLKVESLVDSKLRLKVLHFLDILCPPTLVLDTMALFAYNSDYLIEANSMERIICLI